MSDYNYSAKPTYNPDLYYIQTSRQVSDKLFEMLGGDFSQLPKSYSETFEYQFSDGSISLLSQLSKLGNINHLSYDEWSEIRDNLMIQDAENWSEVDSILSLNAEEFLNSNEENFSEDEFDFQEVSSEKMEQFWGKIISTVYTPGVSSVMSTDGQKPSEENGYLMSPDGNSVEGMFADGDLQFTFTMNRGGEGKWFISYEPTADTKPKLEEPAE